jgi:hypothetical protein
VGVTPNPRWLVTFDDHPHKDEELYEKAFGELIKAAEEDGAPAVLVQAPRRVRTSISSSSSVQSKKTSRSSVSSEDGDKPDDKGSYERSEKKKENKSVSFSDVGASTETRPEAPSSYVPVVRQAAREQRSLRRQAKIDSDVNPALVAAPVSVESDLSKKRRIPPPKQNAKRIKSDDGEEVVKVNLLTGTLYLYRGLHRRAEFVRRV